MAKSARSWIAHQLLPPLLTRGISRLLSSYADRRDTLFDGDDSLYKETVLEARAYGEYGVGSSTIWVLNHLDVPVLAVDTDETWIQRVASHPKSAAQLDAEWIDVGPLEGWGRPAGYSKRDNFRAYTDSIWMRPLKPDVVLIDGRFRVCSFLTSVKYADEGARIIFDDYANRPQYHVVEEVVSADHVGCRQAVFRVPDKSVLDISLINQLIERFRYVLD